MLRANGAALGHLRGEAPHRRARRHSSSRLVCQRELGLPHGGSHGVSEGGLVLRGPGAAALGASGVGLAGSLGQSCIGGDEGQLGSQGGRERGHPTLPAREVPASCPGVRWVGGRPGALPGVCQARMDRWVGVLPLPNGELGVRSRQARGVAILDWGCGVDTGLGEGRLQSQAEAHISATEVQAGRVCQRSPRRSAGGSSSCAWCQGLVRSCPAGRVGASKTGEGQGVHAEGRPWAGLFPGLLALPILGGPLRPGCQARRGGARPLPGQGAEPPGP